MSVIFEKTCKGHRARVEVYDSVMDVVRDCETRKITSVSFDDASKECMRGNWHGVNSYKEALKVMNDGWAEEVKGLQETVNKVKTMTKKRIAFMNDIQGFAPIVPLAILGVPNSMINMTMKPIKSKVISIYYNMTMPASNGACRFVEYGKKVVEAIVSLENSGYRVNLFCLQTYSDESSSDILAIKVKGANQPIDLKRVCFPIMHAAMFRVIGFDWYSKFPKGTYRSGYGTTLQRATNDKKAQEIVKELFGKESVYLMATDVQKNGVEYITEMLKDGKKGGKE